MGAEMTKILRDGYRPPLPEGWPPWAVVARMTVEERMQLPPPDRAPLPMEALDPEFVAGLERWGREYVEKRGQG
jgi:hypothetical protein